MIAMYIYLFFLGHSAFVRAYIGHSAFVRETYIYVHV